MRIVVIGAGFGGLTAAIRLQAQGHDVVLLERLDKPGGRAYVFEQDGFTFDAGPTIITAPWLIEELFASCGRNAADYVTLVPLDPYYNVRFTDGSVFRYDGRPDSVREQVRAFSPGDVAGYERFLAESRRVFETGFAATASTYCPRYSWARPRYCQAFLSPGACRVHSVACASSAW